MQEQLKTNKSMTAFIDEIEIGQAKALIKKYHYLGDKGFLFKVGFGLFLDNEMIGAAVYHGPSAPETVVGAFGLNRNDQNGFWELGRLVLNPERNGANFGSMLIGRSLKILKKKYGCRAIMTYADSNKHHGAIYQATNFTYCGLTNVKKDFYLSNGTKIERGKTKNLEGEWKDRPQKHRYVIVYDKKLQLLWPVLAYLKKDMLPKEQKVVLENTNQLQLI